MVSVVEEGNDDQGIDVALLCLCAISSSGEATTANDLHAEEDDWLFAWGRRVVVSTAATARKAGCGFESTPKFLGFLGHSRCHIEMVVRVRCVLNESNGPVEKDDLYFESSSRLI